MSLNTTKYPAIDLIAHFEGCHLVAYICPAGVPTIGYGHTKTVTIEDVRNKRTISRAMAEDLLVQDYVDHRDALLNSRKGLSGLPAHMVGALVSLAFNIGVRGAAGSTAVRRALAGEHVAAAAAILLWDKARVNGVLTPLAGLTRRRRAEANLYMTGTWSGTGR